MTCEQIHRGILVSYYLPVLQEEKHLSAACVPLHGKNVPMVDISQDQETAPSLEEEERQAATS